jgi:hypothetical protein
MTVSQSFATFDKDTFKQALAQRLRVLAAQVFISSVAAAPVGASSTSSAAAATDVNFVLVVNPTATVAAANSPAGLESAVRSAAQSGALSSVGVLSTSVNGVVVTSGGWRVPPLTFLMGLLWLPMILLL